MTRTLHAGFAAAKFFLALAVLLPLRAEDGSPVSPVAPSVGGGAASPVSPVSETQPAARTLSKEEIEIRVEMATLKGEMRKTARETGRLQSELDALRRENTDLKKNALNQENERGVLIQKLAAAQLAAKDKEKTDAGAAVVFSELASARLTIASLTAQMEKLTQEKDLAAKDTSQTKQDAAAANEKLATARTELGALRKELAAAWQGAETMSGQLQTLTVENRRLVAQASEEKTNHAKVADDATRNLAEAQKEAVAAQTENSMLNARLVRLSAESESVARGRDEALAARDAAQNQLKTTETALAEANKARDELAKHTATLEKQHAEATTAAAAAIEDLRKQLGETGEKLATSLRNHQLRQDESAALQKRLDEADGENSRLAKQLTEAEAGLAAAEKRAGENEQTAAQLVIVRENLRQMQAQSADVAGENARLKTQIALLTQAQQRLQPATTAAAAGTVLAAEANTPSRPSGQPAAQQQTTASGQPASSPSAAPSGTAAPATIREHAVGTGETLWSIARKYYSTSESWGEIYEANRDQLKSPDALKPGMKLRIP